ncbi:alkyl hydroperoxide reductase-like protein/ thiol specific antioxidant/ mal allergen [Microdochium bolleyi]|uniref:thioredoxin-dependent peroxiredoxin n=1 Tax=Microdochium bolleyi TaxID=196109 RepID=A0A136J8Z0_9PEZI|nr:alkyl hydroperoxide reductase-like protein/ thiol specific antioxidant/ mal allergen [Microdochium bolleyi]
MGQQEDLKAISANIKSIADPVIFEKIYGHLEHFTETFSPGNDATIKAGDLLPSFTLPDATGTSVSSADLLNSSAILITFYRGSWCPYCNIAVQYLQRHLDDFRNKGVTLVAISPELPDYSMGMVDKQNIEFPVLTDMHNTLAKKLGILYDQSSARELHGKIGVDLKARNDEDTWEVPIPTTLLVDQTGVVRNVYIEADFRKRLDPREALAWVDAL